MPKPPALTKTEYPAHTDDNVPYPDPMCELCLLPILKNPVVCPICLSRYYCSEEHRQAYDARHQQICLTLEEKLRKKTVRFTDMPSITRRAWIIRDWYELHYYTFTRFLVFALRGHFETANMRHHQVTITLRWRPDCKLNPATAFSIESCKIEKTTVARDPAYRTVIQSASQRQDNELLKHFKSYHTDIPVVFKVDDDQFRWVTTCHLHTSPDWSEFIGHGDVDRLDYSWFAIMKWVIEEGFTWRRLTLTDWKFVNIWYWSMGYLKHISEKQYRWVPVGDKTSSHLRSQCYVRLLSDWDESDGHPMMNHFPDYTDGMEAIEMNDGHERCDDAHEVPPPRRAQAPPPNAVIHRSDPNQVEEDDEGEDSDDDRVARVTKWKTRQEAFETNRRDAGNTTSAASNRKRRAVEFRGEDDEPMEDVRASIRKGKQKEVIHLDDDDADAMEVEQELLGHMKADRFPLP